MQNKSGECSYEAGSLFVGTLIDVERIAKHCSNIGVSLAVQYRRGTLPEEEFIRRIHRGDTEHFVEHYINYKNGAAGRGNAKRHNRAAQVIKLFPAAGGKPLALCQNVAGGFADAQGVLRNVVAVPCSTW